VANIGVLKLLGNRITHLLDFWQVNLGGQTAYATNDVMMVRLGLTTVAE
jgi:hypothetical protein